MPPVQPITYAQWTGVRRTSYFRHVLESIRGFGCGTWCLLALVTAPVIARLVEHGWIRSLYSAPTAIIAFFALRQVALGLRRVPVAALPNQAVEPRKRVPVALRLIEDGVVVGSDEGFLSQEADLLRFEGRSLSLGIPNDCAERVEDPQVLPSAGFVASLFPCRGAIRLRSPHRPIELQFQALKLADADGEGGINDQRQELGRLLQAWADAEGACSPAVLPPHYPHPNARHAATGRLLELCGWMLLLAMIIAAVLRPDFIESAKWLEGGRRIFIICLLSVGATVGSVLLLRHLRRLWPTYLRERRILTAPARELPGEHASDHTEVAISP